MNLICPICNGLAVAEIPCSHCGQILTDEGMVTDYWGPYSPYEIQLIGQVAAGKTCTHLLHCRRCGEQIQKAFPKSEF